MTIIEVAKQVKDFKEVEKALDYFLPKPSAKGRKATYGFYKDLLEAIKGWKKLRVNPNETLEIQLINDDFDKSQYFGIHIKAPKSKYGCFSLSFMPWKKLASYKVDQATLESKTYAEIMAFFIWEITFYGDESQMNEQAKELGRRVKEIKAEKAKL